VNLHVGLNTLIVVRFTSSGHATTIKEVSAVKDMIEFLELLKGFRFHLYLLLFLSFAQ